MSISQNFLPLELADLHAKAVEMKEQGYRFAQTHAVNTENDGIELYYSFMKDNVMVNYVIKGVTPDMPVESISDVFIGSFVFENEARELFGVNMTEIAIDFGGTMYMPAETEPMTFMSPELKAEKDKQRKIALAKAAKAKKDAEAKEAAEKAAAEGDAAPAAAAEKPAAPKYASLEEEIAAKTAGMDPEKAAKVRAALEKKAAREAAAKGGEQ